MLTALVRSGTISTSTQFLNMAHALDHSCGIVGFMLIINLLANYIPARNICATLINYLQQIVWKKNHFRGYVHVCL